MKYGIYTEELNMPDILSLFKAIADYGFSCVQWDFLNACDEEMPLNVDEVTLKLILDSAKENNITFSALTGTFNMAHVNQSVREDGLKRLRYMASLAKRFDCGLITLCCGSRDDDMWRIHPDNDTPEAWRDMLWTMERAVQIAEEYDLKLGIEIEASNVVHTPKQARRLFDEIGSDRLGLILDGANLYPHGNLSKDVIRSTMAEAFELFSDRIVLAHGKDLKSGPGIEFTYAGNGIVDFPYFIEMLEQIDYQGALIMHGMQQKDEYPKAMSYLRTLV